MAKSHKINIEFQNMTTTTLNLDDLEEGTQHHQYGSYTKSTLVRKGHGTKNDNANDSKTSLSKDNDGSNDNTNNAHNKWRASISYYIPILHPFGPFRCFWNATICIALIYTCIEIPVSLAFNVVLDMHHFSGIISFTIDLLLLIDIFITFRTAYFDKWDRLRLIIDEWEIAKKYLFGWFIVDLLTSIPFEFMVSTSNTTNIIKVVKIFRVFRFVRIIKILRLFKMIKYFDGFMSQFVIREVLIVLKFFKVFALMVLFAHLAACTWFFVGYSTIHNSTGSWVSVQFDTTDISVIDSYSTFTKYSYSWYWAVVTLFTTGYGDIVATPGNKAEQWLVSICVLVGTCFFAYFIGTLTSLITDGDRIKSVEIQKLEEAQAFCDQKKLPRELSRAILTHIRYHCGYNYVFDENELIQSLPPYLQNDIHSYLAQTILMQLDFFKSFKKNLQILGQISLKMRSISCNENYCLFQRSDRAKEIYIQRTGESIIDYHDGSTQLLKRGDVIGERSIFSPKRKHTVKCHTFSEFYVLCVQDIVNILQTEYPTTWRKRWRNMETNLKNAMKKQKKYIRQIDFNFHNKLKNQKEKPSSPHLQEPNHSNHTNALHAFMHQSSIISTQSRSFTKDGIKSVHVNEISINTPRKVPHAKSTHGKMDTVYAISAASTLKHKNQRSRSLQQLPSIGIGISKSNPSTPVPKLARKKTRFGIFIKRNSLDRDDAIHRAARKRGNTNRIPKNKLNDKPSFYDHASGGISSSKDSSDDSGDVVPRDYDINVVEEEEEKEEKETSNTHQYDHYDDIVAGVDNMDQLFKKTKSTPHITHNSARANSVRSRKKKLSGGGPKSGARKGGKFGAKKRRGPLGGKHKKIMKANFNNTAPKVNISNLKINVQNDTKKDVDVSKEEFLQEIENAQKQKMETIHSISYTSMAYNNNSNSSTVSDLIMKNNRPTTPTIYEDEDDDCIKDTKKTKNQVKFKDVVVKNDVNDVDDADDEFIITEDYDNFDNDNDIDIDHINFDVPNSDSTKL